MNWLQPDFGTSDAHQWTLFICAIFFAKWHPEKWGETGQETKENAVSEGVESPCHPFPERKHNILHDILQGQVVIEQGVMALTERGWFGLD